ncbi:SRPBCC family protein [Nocardioides humi]|uniref:SRPBCC family protein n=1 Tax=Nocardioides humi TaxID=449461 RepID=A0ABN2BAA0_9ACTN|nr:SRPBCC family protein [Nocardioides humi]
MAALHPCDRVGVDFVDSAPHRFANSVDLAITPEQLFEVFADAEAWPRWASVIRHVEWTSPLPPRAGSTRAVSMLAGLEGAEEFLVWDPPRQMAFRFNEASERSIRAFAERYDIVPTPGGCRLTWTLALDVGGIGRHFMPLSGLVSNAAFRHFLKRLRGYTDERFG